MTTARHGRRRRRGVAALFVVLLAGACGRSDGDDAFARLAVLDPNAEHRDAPTEDFIVAEDGLELDVGNDVRTDEQGFAEVAYADGSLTRLDAGTVFRVTELAGSAAVPEIEVALDSGRVWNQVREVTGSHGRFEVDTAVGVAAVRGTAYTIDCEDGGPCRFAVHEGTVEVTTNEGEIVTIDAGEYVEVQADGEVSDEGPVPADLVEPGGWVDRNQDLDQDLGTLAGLRGNCSASLSGQNIWRATTPATAVVVDIADGAPIEAAALGEVTSYEVALRAGPFTVPAARAHLTPPDDRWTGGVAVADYAFVGVGLYAVRATTEGTPCALDAYVRVVGRNPMSTVLGVLGLLLLLLGLLALIANHITRRAARGQPGSPRDGHRLRGGLGGAAAGLGAVLVLQQYGYVPFLHWSFLAVPAVLAVYGVALGWPGSATSEPEVVTP